MALLTANTMLAIGGFILKVGHILFWFLYLSNERSVLGLFQDKKCEQSG